MFPHRLPIALLSALLAAAIPAGVLAQAPAPTTQVLTMLTIKPGVDRAQIMRVMPDEVRETVKLYLDGKIQQWYSRSDGRGVVFMLNAGSVADAEAITDGLPLSKADLATFEFVALTPLTPLRMLLNPPAAPAKDDRER